MHLMSKNLWGILKGTEPELESPNNLIEWQIRDNNAKSIIDLALSDFGLHLIDLDKSSKEIWEELQ